MLETALAGEDHGSLGFVACFDALEIPVRSALLDHGGNGLADPAVRKSDGTEWRIMLSGSGYYLISVPLGL